LQTNPHSDLDSYQCEPSLSLYDKKFQGQNPKQQLLQMYRSRLHATKQLIANE